jgi:hypothetical protein
VSCTDGREPATDWYLKSLLITKMLQIFKKIFIVKCFALSLRVGDLGSNQKNKIKIMIGVLYFTFNRQNFLFVYRYLAKKLFFVKKCCFIFVSKVMLFRGLFIASSPKLYFV